MNYRAYRRSGHSWYFVSGHDSLLQAKLDLLERSTDTALCIRNIRGELVWKQPACEPNTRETNMTLNTNKCERIPFPVEEIRVSEDNIEEVAEWCGGKILTDDQNEPYIEVEVSRPFHEGQKRAYVGDHILKSESSTAKNPGFKVYLHDAFMRCFRRVQPTTDRRLSRAQEAVEIGSQISGLVYELKEKGYSNVDIASRVGIHESSVRNMLKGPAIKLTGESGGNVFLDNKLADGTPIGPQSGDKS